MVQNDLKIRESRFLKKIGTRDLLNKSPNFGEGGYLNFLYIYLHVLSILNLLEKWICKIFVELKKWFLKWILPIHHNSNLRVTMNFSLLDPILIFLEIYYVFPVYLFWCG